MDNQSFYDKLYYDRNERYSFEVLSKTEAFKFLVKKKKIDFQQKKILDIGFGSGNLLAEARSRGAACYGAEISQTAIDNLQGEGYCLRLVLGNQLPFDSNFFDIIIASHVIEHIEDEAVILDEIKRVMKPNGCFITGVPSGKRFNPLHFRDYSRNDSQRLMSRLDSDCLFYHNFGSPFFNFFYWPVKKIGDLIARAANFLASFNRQAKDSFVEEGQPEVTPDGFLRKIYQKTIVRLLIWLYRADSHLMNWSGIEIWFLFQKRN